MSDSHICNTCFWRGEPLLKTETEYAASNLHHHTYYVCRSCGSSDVDELTRWRELRYVLNPSVFGSVERWSKHMDDYNRIQAAEYVLRDAAESSTDDALIKALDTCADVLFDWLDNYDPTGDSNE